MEAEFLKAVQAGQREQVAQMLDADPMLINTTNANGVSALLLAVYSGERALADDLIARGVLLNVFEAAAANQVDRLKALLDADPALANAYAPDGFQPLGLAAFFGHFEAARLLLERGAPINSPSRNPQQVMPLHSSVAGQHFALSQLLLERGADVNAAQEAGFTPLLEAAQNGQREMIDLLLTHGADKSARTSDGQSAVDLARKAGHVELIDLLSP
ncbi:MAG TPA: ankyrin repeat domain-containing protein [Phototrophicaceae bacterium]|nr:ankyrin repeat domain-containing protein [Phototrophicaceae bacterium]